MYICTQALHDAGQIKVEVLFFNAWQYRQAAYKPP